MAGEYKTLFPKNRILSQPQARIVFETFESN